MSRREWIKIVHLGAQRLGMDEPTRRSWMEKHTGKRSSTDCTDRELSRLCDLLRAAGALDDGRPLGKADSGGKGLDRPTRKQWIKLKVLCERRGWSDGFDDPMFATFVRRIAKVDNPRFLTRNGVRAVILGLERWIEHDRKKQEHDQNGADSSRCERSPK